jgi:hypothetical protein
LRRFIDRATTSASFSTEIRANTDVIDARNLDDVLDMIGDHRSQRLGLRMSELFAEDSGDQSPAVTARRSLGDIDKSVRVTTPNYDYFYLCTELRRKRMVPVITKIRASSREQFGELVRHAGEEFIYVIKGRIVVHTQFYDLVTLGEGQAIYIDSDMGHAYVTATGCHEAEVLGVMSSADAITTRKR